MRSVRARQTADWLLRRPSSWTKLVRLSHHRLPDAAAGPPLPLSSLVLLSHLSTSCLVPSLLMHAASHCSIPSFNSTTTSSSSSTCSLSFPSLGHSAPPQSVIVERQRTLLVRYRALVHSICVLTSPDVLALQARPLPWVRHPHVGADSLPP